VCEHGNGGGASGMEGLGVEDPIDQAVSARSKGLHLSKHHPSAATVRPLTVSAP